MKKQSIIILSIVVVLAAGIPIVYSNVNSDISAEHNIVDQNLTELRTPTSHVLNNGDSDIDKQIYPPPSDSTLNVFTRIMSKASNQNWQNLDMPELMTKIAFEFVETPYVSGTLENPAYEQCRINFGGLDCVTFYEAVLCIARIITLEKTTLADLLSEVEYTRYRHGKLGDYATRLHYTSEWISDNQKKGVVKDITPELAATKHVNAVHFMSQNPDKYPALVEYPELVSEIAEFEQGINKSKRVYIPQTEIESVYSKLQNCDIVCLATSIGGLDYAHTGMVHFDEAGNCRLLHASTKHGVTLDVDLAEYVRGIKFFIGISVVRPINPLTTTNR